MTDAQQRQLQRASAQGDQAAEAQVLLERLRAGEISEERLKLACYLGHEPARVALGESAPEVPGEIRMWAFGLWEWGKETQTRCAVAAGRLALPIWLQRVPDDAGAIHAVHAAENWILCMCEQHRETALDAAQIISSRMDEGILFECVAGAAGTQKDKTGHASGAMEVAAGLISKVEVRAAIQAELLPWCLGTGDPVRDRVEARGQDPAKPLR